MCDERLCSPVSVPQILAGSVYMFIVHILSHVLACARALGGVAVGVWHTQTDGLGVSSNLCVMVIW